MSDAADNLLVRTVGLSRCYGKGAQEVVALASATCTVMPGERIALMGPSGSGKSTLLGLLGGLDQPSGGDISWPLLGRRDELRPAQVAFIFQGPSLLAPLTVVENVELPLLLAGASAASARQAAQQALSRLGLDDLATKLPEELSGGQASRVAVARALSYQPRLILADEPTGQLDRATAVHMLDTLLSVIEGTETALVVATHDIEVARRMKQVWRIEHGHLEVNR